MILPHMKKLLFLFIVSLLTQAEGFSQSITKKIKLDSQNINVEITDDGKGDITLLFVHGWCINKSYWSDQVDYYKNKYRVITVDLVGFGNSDKNRYTWSMEEYGKDISGLMTQLDLKNVILIGHSMAGDIILEAANNVPERVLGFVGIDNFTNVGKNESKQLGMNKYFRSMKKNYPKVGEEYVQTLFYNNTDSRNRARVLEDFAKVEPIIAISCLEHSADYSGKTATNLKKLGKKVYLINCDKNSFNPKGFENNGIAFEMKLITGTGHYPMIEKPKEFNQLLDKTIDKIKIGGK